MNRARLVFAALALLFVSHLSWAQALATATGGGSYVAVGGGVSAFNSAYGQQTIGGAVVFADANASPRLGLEAEARFLRLHSQDQLAEANYLGGLRVVILQQRYAPYAKLLAGVGHIDLPFHYAQGNFLTVAPGGGLDIALTDRITLRAVDVEYQIWRSFPYGALHPYGLSTGIRLRLNGIERYPHGTRHRH